MLLGAWINFISDGIDLFFHAYCSLRTWRFVWEVFIKRLTYWDHDKIADISQTKFFKCIFVKENVFISIEIKYIAEIGSDNGLAPTKHNPLCKPMMISLLKYQWVTQPRCVKYSFRFDHQTWLCNLIGFILSVFQLNKNIELRCNMTRLCDLFGQNMMLTSEHIKNDWVWVLHSFLEAYQQEWSS